VTTLPVSVTVNGDVKNEVNETLVVNPERPVNRDGRRQPGHRHDHERRRLPALSINDVAIVEGNAGTTTLGFTVSLSAPSALTVTVGYAHANGTATTATGDYLVASGTLTFTPGVTSQPVSVTVNGDVKNEADELLAVNLSGPVNATVADSQGIGLIRNDDAVPALSITTWPWQRATRGRPALGFTVSLLGGERPGRQRELRHRGQGPRRRPTATTWPRRGR